MDKIIKLLNDEQKKKEITLSKDEEEELLFLSNFLSSIDITDYHSIVNLDKNDFLVAVLCCTNLLKEKFAKFKKASDVLINLNSITDSKPLFEVLKSIFKFKDANLIDELCNIPLLNDDDDTIREIVKNHKREYEKFYEMNLIDDLSKIHIKLSRTICRSEEEREALFSLLKEYPEETLTALIGILAILTIKEDIKDTEGKKINKKDFDNSIKEKLYKSNLLPTLKIIEDRKRKLAERKKELERKKRSSDKKVDTLTRELKQKEKSKNITLSPTFLSLVENDNIKFALLYRTLLHNKEGYIETEEKLKLEKSLSLLEKIFKDNGFDFLQLEEKDRKLLGEYGNCSLTEKILNILNQKQFKFLNEKDSSFTKILLLADTNTTGSISKLLLQDLLSPTFVLNNPSIFYSEKNNLLKLKLKEEETNKNSSLLENVNTLKDKKINIKSISLNNPNLLLEDSNLLKEKFNFLKDYDLSFQDATRLDLVEDTSLVRYLDLFIELGLYPFIRNNLSIISKDCESLINKLSLCRQLDINVKDKKTLDSIIDSSLLKIGKLVITQDIIDSSVDNSVSNYANKEIFKLIEENNNNNNKEKKEIDELLSFKDSPYTYNIDGCIISLNKFLRNYSAIEDNEEFSLEDKIFNSLIYGSKLDDTSINKIKSAIYKSNKALVLK